MPRTARQKSESGIYHIIMRGINRQILFEDEEDSAKMVRTLQRYREKSKYELYAYCLMGNHLHLLLKEGQEPLETVMRRICGSYVLWYNKKYDRVGYLFQDRYKSEPVEGESYFLTVLRYIFRNPQKAGIVAKADEYAWSNYKDYLEKSFETDTAFALNLFDADEKKAVQRFIDWINTENDEACLDITEKKQLPDVAAIKIIKKHCKVSNCTELQKLEPDKRNEFIKDLKEGYCLSIRQLERLTGISRGIIQRI